MATKKTTNYYYVLVFTDNGPVYVTSVEWVSKTAHWEKDKEPYTFNKTDAEDLAFGLQCNFFNAVVVSSRHEIDCQPYNYADYTCKFELKS